MKIAFIGGGSVQWTVKLAVDMAATAALSGAELALHDIDAPALALLTRAAGRAVAGVGGGLVVRAAADRRDALRGADFVVLCVAIGGLAAMRGDLEIPERYGIRQSVGDTVGPGGLARGLRHVPFAVEVAREMERACPDAWPLNLTNPMTTICRGVTRATGVRRRLPRLLGVAPEQLTLEVAGINHLPVITRQDAGGRDGLALLRAWVAEHGTLAPANEGEQENPFRDRLALKLALFEQLGVLFGAGDRHVAEFFGGVLTEATDWGRRYGVLLTTIAQREAQARGRRAAVERGRRAAVERLAAGEGEPPAPSDEQLAGVMAALSGGPAGQFIVNVPNVGQIEDLPRGAVVECQAYVYRLGVRPLATGRLGHAAHAAITPHVDRQELIVEAALTGRRATALAALATDPLVGDPATAGALLNVLLAANAAHAAAARA